MTVDIVGNCDVDRTNTVVDVMINSAISDNDGASRADDDICNGTVDIVGVVWRTNAADDAIGNSAMGDEDEANRADGEFV